MMWNEVSVVSFDAAGTLIYPDPGVGQQYASALHRRGLEADPEVVENGFRRAFRAAAERPRETIDEESERAFWREIVRDSVGSTVSDELFPEVFAELYTVFGRGESWKTFPGVHEILEDLTNAGLGLVVFSNADARFHRVFSELKLARYFRKIFLSTELGAQKPDPRAFHKVRSWLGVEERQILHVGDDPRNDGDGARNAGWNVLLLENRTDASRFAPLRALLER